ncbi:MAG: hypothetical protein WCL32_15335 [Planctomycetota bacterium]
MRKPTDGRPSDDRCVVKVLLVAFKAFFDGTTRKLRLETERLAKTTVAGKVIYLVAAHGRAVVQIAF